MIIFELLSIMFCSISLGAIIEKYIHYRMIDSMDTVLFISDVICIMAMFLLIVN